MDTRQGWNGLKMDTHKGEYGYPTGWNGLKWKPGRVGMACGGDPSGSEWIMKMISILVDTRQGWNK